MKKLAGVFAALTALAMVFTSCGDMNDVKVDPNAMEGNWSYQIFDGSEATSGQVAVITSVGNGATQSGAFGSDPFLVPASSGTVNYIVWDGKGGSDLTISTRTDNPSLDDLEVTLDEGEFVICVFTTSASCDLWVYDSEDDSINLSGGTWPGVSTIATVEVEKYAYEITKIVLTGYETENSVAFCEAWVPGNEWNETTPNYADEPDENGDFVLTFAEPYAGELEAGSALTVKIQILDIADKTDSEAFWSTKVEDGSHTATVTPDATGKSYTLKVTYVADGDNTVELIEN